MSSRKIFSGLVGKIHVVPSSSQKNDLIKALKGMKKPAVLSFVNAHAVNLCFENHCFFEDLLGSDWLLRDGSGMKLAYSFWRKRAGLNMNGTDFIPEIVSRYSGERCLLFGTRNPNLQLASDKINGMGVEVLACEDGFQPLDRYLERAKQYQPKLILLGMGMPKQERLSMLLKEELDYPAIIINGGAVLDFLSGNINRSPKIFRLCGMEWVWRLVLEPSRMWKRYVIGNVKFIYRFLSEPSLKLSAK